MQLMEFELQQTMINYLYTDSMISRVMWRADALVSQKLSIPTKGVHEYLHKNPNWKSKLKVLSFITDSSSEENLIYVMFVSG